MAGPGAERREAPEAVSEGEITALIHLLDDPDLEVQASVHARLRELPPAAEPLLAAASAGSPPPLQAALSQVLRQPRFERLLHAWLQVLAQPEINLEDAVFLLARYGNPDLDEAPYRALLDHLAGQVKPRIAAATGSQRALLLSSFFCDDLGFAGNEQDYYDARNSYLDWVLDHRRGLPITLSVIILLLGKRLDLPLYGINMPAHFLVMYREDASVLFIDLFHGGTFLTRKDCEGFLERAGISVQDSYFEPTTTPAILQRMIRNLLSHADPPAALELAQLLRAI